MYIIFSLLRKKNVTFVGLLFKVTNIGAKKRG